MVRMFFIRGISPNHQAGRLFLDKVLLIRKASLFLPAQLANFRLMIARLPQTLLIYCLTASMLGSTLLVPLAFIDYGLRKEYISEALCINREKPSIGCEGKCYLKKKLTDAANQTNTESTVSQERFQLSFFSQKVSKRQVKQLFSWQLLTYETVLTIGVPTFFTQDIYHPPKGC